MIKNKLQKLPSLMSGALICTVLMLAVYALKGIWPFGIADVTYDDMAQGTLPIYYHLYDWLHGDKAMTFDWYTGLGTNIVNSGTFMPLDIILCLFRRDNLLYALGILIIVKVAASAATSKYVFDKLFPDTNEIWRTTFSIVYAMCSYSMFYYTNSFWLDFVVIFPLVVYGLKRLLVDNKPLTYILFFGYTLYLSVYIGFMVTLAVFFLSGLYIFLICDKACRAQRTCMLGIGTVAGVLISAWHSVPMAIQTLSSKRLETSFEDSTKASPLLEILETDSTKTFPIKLLMLVGLQLAFILTVLFVVRLMKDRKAKEALFVTSCIFVFFSPVLLENINLFWHGGSYIQFPMRFFFICVFVLATLALAYINTYSETLRKPKSVFIKALLFAVIALLTVVFIYALKNYAIDEAKTFPFMLLYASGVPLFFILLCQKKHITRAFCFVLSAVQAMAICYAGIPDIYEQTTEDMLYNSPSYLEYCKEVSQMELDCGELGRIKNPDTSLNTNYPFILQTPALSNWTHNIPKSVQDSAILLGYSSQYTRILDSCGTAFSDGLLSIRKAVARKHYKLADRFKPIESTENFKLYENTCALDIGLLGDKSITDDIEGFRQTDKFALQNKLYRAFSQTDEQLFHVASNKGETADRLHFIRADESEMMFAYTAGENEELYIHVSDNKNKSLKIFVDSNRILAPYYKQTTYGYFPSQAVNGILTLGNFKKNETVIISVRCINGEVFTKDNIQLAYASLDKISALNTLYSGTVTDLATGKESISLNYNNTHGEGRYLFLPVTNDGGWKCTLNGENAKVDTAIGSYIAIELPEGSGTIKLTHKAPGFYMGVILSLTGLLLCGLLMIMKKRGYSIPKFIATPVYVLFIAAFAAASVLIYAVTIVFFFKGFVEKANKK